jgi:hypothetical protein
MDGDGHMAGSGALRPSEIVPLQPGVPLP